MKISLKLIHTLFLIAFGFLTLSAQITQTNTVEVEKVKSFDSKEYKDWQKIKLKSFTFYAPKELKEKKVSCYEGSCYTFESGNFNLHIDINYDAYRPTFERSYLDYIENIYNIDEGKAWTWFYEKKESSKYAAGVLFYLSKPKENRIGIYLNSNDKAVYKTAEKVFKSVEFETK